MQQIPYKAPQFHETSFNCPFCNAFSLQIWCDLYRVGVGQGYQVLDEVDACLCAHCGKYSIWQDQIMVYPSIVGVGSPNQDMGEDIQGDYREAAEILQRSPRGAAALLRLAIQKLCIQLGEDGKNLNTDIGNLVAKGLPAKVQESLDALRVIGNEAVHPGEMDLRDDMEIASSLFKLLNFIAEKLITEPKEIEGIYAKLPTAKVEEISKRDGAV